MAAPPAPTSAPAKNRGGLRGGCCVGFRGRPLLPAASAFSGGLAGHALEEREFEGITQRAPLGRPRTELVCKHVSMCPDWPVLLLGAMWVRSLRSHVLVREGFCSRLGAARRPPRPPPHPSCSRPHHLVSHGFMHVPFHFLISETTWWVPTAAAGTTILCCHFDCAERGMEPREGPR